MGKLPKAKPEEFDHLESVAELTAYVETHDMGPIWEELEQVDDSMEARD